MIILLRYGECNQLMSVSPTKAANNLMTFGADKLQMSNGMRRSQNTTDFFIHYHKNQSYYGPTDYSNFYYF